MSKAVLGELPEGVESAMFLRDGWPDACVCKVVMKNGCVGIGIHRPYFPPVTPEEFDQHALEDAIANVSDTPPDYTVLQEHVAKMAAKASPATAYQEEPDHDLQASLGQKAHD